MQRATIQAPNGQWPSSEAAGTLTLDFDARHRRRIRLKTDQGEDVLLDLAKAAAMADGDGLRTDDGRWLRICAAPEPVIEIRHHDMHELIRLSWHLGNRHLPTEIREHSLRIRPDHVIEDMLRGFGAVLTSMNAPFQPEGGAYGGHGQSSHAPGHHHPEHSHHGDG